MSNINHDLLFKELLTTFFQEFIEAFFPEADQMLDYSHLEFLTQEIIVDLTTGEKKYISSSYPTGSSVSRGRGL